jgi:hypothetical protein
MKKIVIWLAIFLLMPGFASSAQCNVSISIDSNAQTFDKGDKIEFYNKLNSKSFDYIIEYWIEDTNNTIIKQKRNTTNQAKKSFTAKNINTDIVLKARIAHLGCEDINHGDNFAEEKILFNRVIGNSTHHTIRVSFIINKDMQKLRAFANKINYGNKSQENIKYNANTGNDKLKKPIPYFIMILTTLLSIVLIWQR